MAINFPSNPGDGAEYTDPNSGTWTYDAGTNSWTLTGAGSASAFNFIGGHDFRGATEPNGSGAGNVKESGDVWIHDAPDGSINAVYGISGQISRGQLVLWDGSSYVMISGTMPGYPNLDDGNGATLDSRYLFLGSGNFDQEVQSTGTTTFNGILKTDKALAIDTYVGQSVADVSYGISREPNVNDAMAIKHSGSSPLTFFKYPDGNRRIQAGYSTQLAPFYDTDAALTFYPQFTGTSTLWSFLKFDFSDGITGATTAINAIEIASNFGDEADKTQIIGYYSLLNEVAGKSVFSIFSGGTAPIYSEGQVIGTKGFRSVNNGTSAYPLNIDAEGNAPNFFQGDAYIGGSASRNTRELWESTLTEEQKEQLTAGTLAIPANVSTPGDGSFARQWWYDQQSAEDQALIDAGELDYPEPFAAATFIDTFGLGDTTNIDLLATGAAYFKGAITGGGVNAANNNWVIRPDGSTGGLTVTRAAIVTDEQAGTVETLLDIITDLRARVEALEAAAS